MAKVIALYLPQFHPIPENDKWYGKGFTEWTNVVKGKPLFPGHYQPHIPADLGFYDLRMKETIIAQTNLAKEYGVDGFCYWHYWFGNGRRLLKKPFQDFLADKSIDFQFSLAWANETWEKKLWDKSKKNEIIVKQEYPGEKDYTNHFYAMLEAFRDKRYIRISDKLMFYIYKPMNCPDMKLFIDIWRRLAERESLGGFYFIANDCDCRNKVELFKMGFDAICNDNVLNIHHELNKLTKGRLWFQRQVLQMPTVFKYKKAIDYMITSDDYDNNIIPMVAPNWDHSPRSGRKSIILADAKPEYFEKLLLKAFDAIKEKPADNQIIVVRAWNEWGEGNHLEPDLKYGLGYLESLKHVREQVSM